MFEIEGKYTSALLTIDEIEPKTYSQVFELTRKEYLKDCKIVMMPDMHPSKGCVVGTTIDLSNQDIPKLEASLIGTDIGCGVMATWTDQDADKVDFERLDEVVLSLKGKADKDGFGSIGGGNHFIELDRTPDNKVIVVVHSGSRRQGRDVGLRYICKGILQGDDLTGYLSEVERLQNYAKANRKAITDGILRHLGWARTAEIDCPHNYYGWDSLQLHRKFHPKQESPLL